jgi:hypothetical protein
MDQKGPLRTGETRLRSHFPTEETGGQVAHWAMSLIFIATGCDSGRHTLGSQEVGDERGVTKWRSTIEVDEACGGGMERPHIDAIGNVVLEARQTQEWQNTTKLPSNTTLG